VLPELRGEAVAGIDGRGAADRVGERFMLSDQGDGARPGRDRVERLREAGSDEGADWVALPAGPAERVKLGDQRVDLG
jgi:hypothetical protein